MKTCSKRSTRSKRSFRQRKTQRKQRGGGMPLSYFTGGFDTQLVNSTGPDMAAPTDEIIRPALLQTGGSRKQNGGFYPSIMGPFTSNAAAIAVPLAAIVTSQYLGKPPYFSKNGNSTKKKSKKGKRRH